MPYRGKTGGVERLKKPEEPRGGEGKKRKISSTTFAIVEKARVSAQRMEERRGTKNNAYDICPKDRW